MQKKSQKQEIIVGVEQDVVEIERLQNDLVAEVGIYVANLPMNAAFADLSMGAEIFLYTNVFHGKPGKSASPMDIHEHVAAHLAHTPEEEVRLYRGFLRQFLEESEIAELDPLIAEDSIDSSYRLTSLIARLRDRNLEIFDTDHLFEFSIARMAVISKAVRDFPRPHMETHYVARFASNNPMIKLGPSESRENTLRSFIYLQEDEYQAILDGLEYIRGNGTLPPELQIPPDVSPTEVTTNNVKQIIYPNALTNGLMKLCRIPTFRLALMTALGASPEVINLITRSIYPSYFETEIYNIANGLVLKDYLKPRKTSDISTMLYNTYNGLQMTSRDIRKVHITAMAKISESSLLAASFGYAKPQGTLFTSSGLYRYF